MIRPVACVVALAGLLAGCAAPNPQVPPGAAVAPPPTWQAPLPAEAGPVADRWWTAFGDPELDRLEDHALAANSDVAIAVARVAEAHAALGTARAALLPSLDASLAANRERSLDAFGNPYTANTLAPGVSAAYEVDLFGRVHDQASAARSAWLASEAARDAARLSVAGAVATGYVTLLGLDARRAVVAETITARAEALRIAKSRAEAGYTSQLELRQAEAEYQAAALILPQADLAIAKAEGALRVLTGDVPGPVARGRTLATLARPAIPDQGVPSALLRRRPDIASAEYTLAAGDASLAAARAQFLPRIQLAASVNRVFNSALPDPVTLWSVGGSVLAPLFEGGRLRAGVEGAAARRDQAAFAYRKAALNAFREVEDAAAAVSSLARQRAAAEAQRVAVAEALRHATNRYHAGYTSYLEELDAERALLAADLTLVQVRSDQFTALVTLYQALGGGWEGLPEG